MDRRNLKYSIAGDELATDSHVIPYRKLQYATFAAVNHPISQKHCHIEWHKRSRPRKSYFTPKASF